jgi:hypothetical protein
MRKLLQANRDEPRVKNLRFRRAKHRKFIEANPILSKVYRQAATFSAAFWSFKKRQIKIIACGSFVTFFKK